MRLCEAVMRYCQIPAGDFRRQFGFQSLPDYDGAIWKAVKEEADGGIRPLPENLIGGSDISVKALEYLVNAPWPGNVRQLQREIERLVALCPHGHTIESTMISPVILNHDSGADIEDTTDLNLKRRLAAVERDLILKAIECSDGNHSEAARLLGVTRNGLTMKMGRLGVRF